MVRIHSPRPTNSLKSFILRAAEAIEASSGFFVTMPKTMPDFCIARTFEGCEHGCGLWMDVSLCSGKIAVPGKVGECVRIHHLSPASEASMAESVQPAPLDLCQCAGPVCLVNSSWAEAATPKWDHAGIRLWLAARHQASSRPGSRSTLRRSIGTSRGTPPRTQFTLLLVADGNALQKFQAARRSYR